ncbi:MAG TPA: HAD-IA family hydrolase, partial [Acidobacteriota bacterium]
MKWKAILFDRDGTLFDSLPVILRSFNHAIEPFTDKRPANEQWFAAFGPSEPKVLAHFVGAERQMQAYERFLRYYREHIAEVILCEGVLPLLLKLKNAGVLLALFTGGGRVSTQICLENSGMISLFDVWITGDDVEHPKPDAEGVLKAMELLRVNPQETLVIGDAASDVSAGKSAGATTVLARWCRGQSVDKPPTAPD